MPGGPISQVCRPHFAPALHPWGFPTTSASSNGSAEEKPQSPLGATGMVPTSLAGHAGGAGHPFPFPPTPPKDATPDSISASTTSSSTNNGNATSNSSASGANNNNNSGLGLGGSAGTDYQTAVAHAAVMGAFMHHQDALGNASSASSCDIKPTVMLGHHGVGGASSPPHQHNAQSQGGQVKQREGNQQSGANASNQQQQQQQANQDYQSNQQQQTPTSPTCRESNYGSQYDPAAASAYNMYQHLQYPSHHSHNHSHNGPASLFSSSNHHAAAAAAAAAAASVVPGLASAESKLLGSHVGQNNPGSPQHQQQQQQQKPRNKSRTSAGKPFA